MSQFDVICMLSEGKERASVAAGIANEMAERITKLAKRVGVRKEVAMTGGVAKNEAVLKSLEEVLGLKLLQMDRVDPQIVGALGAALFARERFAREQKRAADC